MYRTPLPGEAAGVFRQHLLPAWERQEQQQQEQEGQQVGQQVGQQAAQEPMQ